MIDRTLSNNDQEGTYPKETDKKDISSISHREKSEEDRCRTRKEGRSELFVLLIGEAKRCKENRQKSCISPAMTFETNPYSRKYLFRHPREFRTISNQSIQIY